MFLEKTGLPVGHSESSADREKGVHVSAYTRFAVTSQLCGWMGENRAKGSKYGP